MILKMVFSQSFITGLFWKLTFVLYRFLLHCLIFNCWLHILSEVSRLLAHFSELLVAGFTDETPRDYHCNLGPDGRRRDADERPELCRGTVEFVATREYMVRPILNACRMYLISSIYPSTWNIQFVEMTHNFLKSVIIPLSCLYPFSIQAAARLITSKVLTKLLASVNDFLYVSIRC